MSPRALKRTVISVALFFVLLLLERAGMIPMPVDRSGVASSSTTIVVEPEFIRATSTRIQVNAQVERVVDGDTIEVVFLSGEKAKVRLLGVNTPESVDPRRPIECFGKEASQFLKGLAEGKRVELREDPKADTKDKYGRLLRDVYLEDGIDINATLVASGYAHAYLSFPLSGSRKAQLKELETQAKTSEAGLWNPQTCSGDTKR